MLFLTFKNTKNWFLFSYIKNKIYEKLFFLKFEKDTETVKFNRRNIHNMIYYEKIYIFFFVFLNRAKLLFLLFILYLVKTNT